MHTHNNHYTFSLVFYVDVKEEEDFFTHRILVLTLLAHTPCFKDVKGLCEYTERYRYRTCPCHSNKHTNVILLTVVGNHREESSLFFADSKDFLYVKVIHIVCIAAILTHFVLKHGYITKGFLFKSDVEHVYNV